MTALVQVSYATGPFVAYQRLLTASALNAGCSDSLALGPDDLDAPFRRRHGDLLRMPKGAGYWIWKPQVIAQSLATLRDGDLLLYCDAAMQIVGDVWQLSERLDQSGSDILVFGEWSTQSAYTKRDAFVLMGLDTPGMAAAPQRLAVRC